MCVYIYILDSKQQNWSCFLRQVLESFGDQLWRTRRNTEVPQGICQGKKLFFLTFYLEIRSVFTWAKSSTVYPGPEKPSEQGDFSILCIETLAARGVWVCYA